MILEAGSTINVIVPVGAVGAGVRSSDMAAGIAMGAHAIACDAGSTDSGPAYLATGKSKYSRDAVKADLRILMVTQSRAKIPLLIGSCGTSGCDMALDWMLEIALEIAREEDLNPKITLLYSEQGAATLDRYVQRGAIRPLAPVMSVDRSIFERCDHIVALMGPEPYVAALRDGADIVLGGRTTDTAVIAAVPLMLGAGSGPAWHAGKTAECGGQCTVFSRDGGVMVRVGREHFEIEPLSANNACTPATVSAHMLYENSDPFRLIEPGGILDVTKSRYRAISDRVVRVQASVFEPAPYTMKLEGAAGGPFQTIMLVGIQDPKSSPRSIDLRHRCMSIWSLASSPRWETARANSTSRFVRTGGTPYPECPSRQAPPRLARSACCSSRQPRRRRSPRRSRRPATRPSSTCRST